MNRSLKIIMLLSLTCMCISQHCLWADNGIPYRFTDTDPDDDEEDEYFDAYGNRIYDYEYQAKQEAHAKQLQEEAAKPFGQAGSKFGSAWGTNSAGTSPSPSRSSGSSPEIVSENKPLTEKPKVLVS